MPWDEQTPQAQSDFAYDNWDKHLAPGFRAALQNIYGRGLDIGSEAPWQVVDQAFPRAGSAQLRQSHDQDLLDAARMFMSGGAPQKPGMVTPPPLWRDDPSEDGSGGVVGNSGNITGFDPGIAMTGVQAALAGLGFPGLPGVAGNVVSTLSSALGVGKGLSSLTGTSPNLSSNLTALTPEGDPVNVAALKTGFFDSFLNAMRGNPNFAFTTDPALASFLSQNPTMFSDPESMNALTAQGMKFGNTPAAVLGSMPGFTEGGPHPAFGFGGFNAPSQSPSPYGQTPDVNAPKGEARSDAPPDDGGKAPPSDAPPSDAPPSDDGTATGPAGPGNNGAESYTGGPVADKRHKGFRRSKGSHVVPIDAHEGEFVVNANATKAAKPALEALNSLIPSSPRNREDLAQIIERAAKYFDVA